MLSLILRLEKLIPPTGKSRQELDFIIPDNGKITVIEVKSGDQYKKHASLNSAIENFESRINKAIVFGKCNVEVGGEVLYLPLYMAGLV